MRGRCVSILPRREEQEPIRRHAPLLGSLKKQQLVQRGGVLLSSHGQSLLVVTVDYIEQDSFVFSHREIFAGMFDKGGYEAVGIAPGVLGSLLLAPVEVQILGLVRQALFLTQDRYFPGRVVSL